MPDDNPRVLPLEGHAVPIRHGLPTQPLAADTAEAKPWATPDSGDEQTTEDSTDWPSLALAQVKWLSNRLGHPTIPAAVFDLAAPLRQAADYPDAGGLTLPFARARLLPKSTPHELLDRVWAFIIEATRAKQGAWNLFALGMGVPGLLKAAARLAPRKDSTHRQIWHAQQILAAEFVMRLHDEIKIDRPRIYGRLKDQCVYAAKGDWRAAARERNTIMNYDDFVLAASANAGPEFERVSNDMYARALYPDGEAFLALVRLVRRNKISKDDAALIGYTCVAGSTVAQAGALLGMSPTTARGRYHRAKDLIGKILDPAGRYRPHQETSP